MEQSDLLEEHMPAFKAMVLGHVQNVLPESDWKYYRRVAKQHQRRSIPWWDDPLLQVDIPKLIDQATTTDGLSLDELMIPEFEAKAVEIGRIDDQPVWYVAGQGIYAWGLDRQFCLTLSFWATHPSYPPGW